MTEMESFPTQNTRRFQFDWLLPVLWKPKRIFDQVIEAGRSSWLTPLLTLTLAAVVLLLVAGPLRQAAAQATPQEPPADFQYWSPEQQQQFMEAQASTTSPVNAYVLPGISALLKLWLGWLILAAVLHLVMTLAGGRTTMTTVLNIVAWASVPILIRYLVQIGSMATTHQLITAPGLSGFRSDSGSMLANFSGSLLGLIDIYLVWQTVLIIVGLKNVSGMSVGKALTGTLIAVVITLALMALPGFLATQLGGLLTSQPMYFF